MYETRTWGRLASNAAVKSDRRRGSRVLPTGALTASVYLSSINRQKIMTPARKVGENLSGISHYEEKRYGGEYRTKHIVHRMDDADWPQNKRSGL